MRSSITSASAAKARCAACIHVSPPSRTTGSVLRNIPMASPVSSLSGRQDVINPSTLASTPAAQAMARPAQAISHDLRGSSVFSASLLSSCAVCVGNSILTRPDSAMSLSAGHGHRLSVGRAANRFFQRLRSASLLLANNSRSTNRACAFWLTGKTPAASDGCG